MTAHVAPTGWWRGLIGALRAVIGPVLYASIVAALLPILDRGAYQVAIASLLGLLAIGIALVVGVPDVRGTDGDIRPTPTEPAIVPPGETAR